MDGIRNLPLDKQPLECAEDDCDVLHPNAVAQDKSMAGWRCHQHAPPPLAERAELLALEPGSAYLMVITVAEPMKWSATEKLIDRVRDWLQVVRDRTSCDIMPILFEGGVAVQFARVFPVRNIATDALDAMMAARFCHLIDMALRREHR